MSTTSILTIVLFLISSADIISGRSLAQSAAPPNPSFGGPALQLDPTVVPQGATAKINWHAVGTQNYTSGATSDYGPAGAVADFYLQNGTAIVGKHFFISNGAGGLSPVFTKTDAQGVVTGTVVGAPFQQSPAPAYNDDGGYGSVPTLLLKASSADGFFAGVTYVQRTNTLGGIVPGNPKLFTLPASPTGIANKLLAVPYQADYIFFTGGSSATG